VFFSPVAQDLFVAQSGGDPKTNVLARVPLFDVLGVLDAQATATSASTSMAAPRWAKPVRRIGSSPSV
jgi:hypothetical protein